MNNSTSKYQVDELQMDEYLHSRFISVAITFSIIIVIILSVFTFILYKQEALAGLWSFLISVPIITAAFIFGVKRGDDKLRKLSDTEFILTNSGLIQKAPNQVEKDFDFSEIAVMDKRKFGTTIIKGNWLTRINYYRPKKSAYQLDDPKLIFIPSITTNYSELIATIEQARRPT
jgi:hypothetical protein